jgi:flavin-binding protein dodecin
LCALFQRDPKAGLKSDAVDAEQLARRIAGHIEDGKIAHWQVRVKIGATLDD